MFRVPAFKIGRENGHRHVGDAVPRDQRVGSAQQRRKMMHSPHPTTKIKGAPARRWRRRGRGRRGSRGYRRRGGPPSSWGPRSLPAQSCFDVGGLDVCVSVYIHVNKSNGKLDGPTHISLNPRQINPTHGPGVEVLGLVRHYLEGHGVLPQAVLPEDADRPVGGVELD